MLKECVFCLSLSYLLSISVEQICILFVIVSSLSICICILSPLTLFIFLSQKCFWMKIYSASSYPIVCQSLLNIRVFLLSLYLFPILVKRQLYTESGSCIWACVSLTVSSPPTFLCLCLSPWACGFASLSLYLSTYLKTPLSLTNTLSFDHHYLLLNKINHIIDYST